MTRSTTNSNETIVWEDGKEYPLVKIHISSVSYPFFTGEEKIIDTEGRLSRFKNRAAAAEARKQELADKAKKAAANKTKKPTLPSSSHFIKNNPLLTGGVIFAIIVA